MGGARGPRTVYVMRSSAAGTDGSGSSEPAMDASQAAKRKVMLARKLPPGGSIKLTETPVKVTAPDGYEEPVITIPQSMMSPAKVSNAPTRCAAI